MYEKTQCGLLDCYMQVIRQYLCKIDSVSRLLIQLITVCKYDHCMLFTLTIILYHLTISLYS